MTLYQKLRWLTRMGVDETISEMPVNRLKKQEKNTTSINKLDPLYSQINHLLFL